MPRASLKETDEQLISRMRPLLADYLTPTGKTWREPPHRMIETQCALCGRVSAKRANDLQRAGRAPTGCPCQGAEKYGRDPRATVLRYRFHAIQQRCTPGGVTSRAHGDRGIECRFSSVEEFIRWMLENLPHPTYTGITIDRVDNSGHYEPGNLRLASYREQAVNRRNVVLVPYMGIRVARHHLWHLVKTDDPDFPLSRDGLVRRLQKGMSVEQALAGPFRRSPSTTSSTPDPAIVSLYRG